MTHPRLEATRILSDLRRLGEGESVRFGVKVDGVDRDAFALRFRGEIVAYLNTCRHQSLNLDFGDGHFLDDRYDALVCCHHGARYDPKTGVCFEGPCVSARLTPLVLEERALELWCVDISPAACSGSSPRPDR